ncbi:hypothetical protein CPC08DRAFT_769899, partial [Agrocybe pediades]
MSSQIRENVTAPPPNEEFNSPEYPFWYRQMLAQLELHYMLARHRMATRKVCSVQKWARPQNMWKMYVKETTFLMAHVGYCTVMGFAVQLPTYFIRIADTINGLEACHDWTEEYVNLGALNETSDQEMDEQILRGFQDYFAWWVQDEYALDLDNRHIHMAFLEWLASLRHDGYYLDDYPYDLSNMGGVDRVAAYLFALGRLRAERTAMEQLSGQPPLAHHSPASPVTYTPEPAPPIPNNPRSGLSESLSTTSETPPESSGLRPGVQIPPPSFSDEEEETDNNSSPHFCIPGLPFPPAPTHEPVKFTDPANPTQKEIKSELGKISRTLANMQNLASRAVALAREAKFASSHRVEILYILRDICNKSGHPFPDDLRLHMNYRDLYPSVTPNNATSGGTSTGYQPPTPPPVRQPRSKFVVPERPEASNLTSEGPEMAGSDLPISLTAPGSHNSNVSQVSSNSDRPHSNHSDETDDESSWASSSDDSMNSDDLLGPDDTFVDPGFETVIGNFT